MEFFDAVDARRSCRQFSKEPVPPEVINKAIDAALLAPNSSNMQLWEFYWVRSPEKKKALAKACFSQPAATTAQELLVCVSNHRIWNRNRKLIIAELKKNPKMPKKAFLYYSRLMPIAYTYDPLNISGWLKKIVSIIVGFFHEVPRGPHLRSEIWEVMTKSTALACENLMLAISAQGYASCPMEGFDEWRAKRVLGLGCGKRITMIIGIGKPEEKGIWGPRFRIPRELTVFEI